ncbi:shewanella-like protein phosphatase 2 [Aristolochia californica]|uniref:shewanella-like protein phosphatase 2 n=1 Tax=Aristolochia californica TaxID=171875 RepID=UPI0035D9B560
MAAKTGGQTAKVAPSSICRDLHLHFSSFIDAFVDFSVSGIFFLQNPRSSDAVPEIRTHYPSQDRLVAVGDLHGDLPKSLQALRVADLIDPASSRWIAGSTTVVQIGDVLDRGPDEIKLLYFLHRLKQDAASHGGSLLTMLGNHEIMNIESDFRYVDPSALVHFENWARWYEIGSKMKSLCPQLGVQPDIFRGIPKLLAGIRDEFQEGFRARIAALRPDGPISKRFLSNNPTVLVVGDSVFVHGGLLKDHVAYGLERINQEVRSWINGLSGRRSPSFVRGRDSVVWLRRFSEESERKCDCSMLELVLATIPGAKRMIMGHTIQQMGINGVCQNRAIRIDVGLSKGCGNGLPEVLEIKGGDTKEIRILTSNPIYRKSRMYESGLRDGDKVGLGILLPENRIKRVEVKA